MNLNTYSNLQKFIKDHNIKYIVFDLKNILLYQDSISITAKQLTEDIYNNGLQIHINETKFSDNFNRQAKIKSDFITCFINPFATHNTLVVISDVVIDNYDIMSPRIMAKDIIKNFLAKTNLKSVYFQPTINFHIFDKVSIKSSSLSSSYKLYTIDEDLNNLRSEICNTLNNIGIKIASHYGHNITKNLCNIQLAPIHLKEVNDQVYLTKYIARKVVESYGKKVTFMPLPFNNMQAIETSLMFNFNDNIKLDYQTIQNCFSKISIKAFTNPTINSFKRVKLHNEDKTICFTSSNKVDLKFADSTADPYLSLSAIILCFLEYFCSTKDLQINNNTKCKKQTLGQALKSLDNDKDFYIKHSNNAISNDFLDHYISLKRKELRSYSTTPTPFEITTYFDI